MSRPPAEKQTAALDEGQGDIAAALADLDTKLAAWLEAMCESQSAVSDQTPRESCSISRSETPAGEQAPDGCAQQDDAMPQGGAELFDGPLPTEVAEAEAEPVQSATPVEKAAEPVEDDQALLASLDEDTANAIRVKRRLSNNQRGVREMLEEIRLERAQRGKTRANAMNLRRTWWRRSGDD